MIICRLSTRRKQWRWIPGNSFANLASSSVSKGYFDATIAEKISQLTIEMASRDIVLLNFVERGAFYELVAFVEPVKLEIEGGFVNKITI